MPRSIEEIDQDIANVQSQIAMRNALGYKHARARAILDHDVSSLDRIYSAMNAAEQNRIAREEQQKFTTSEREATQKFQSEQNDLNRALQKEQMRKNMAIEQANLLKQLQDRYAEWLDIKDLVGESDAKKTAARTAVELARQKALESGVREADIAAWNTVTPKQESTEGSSTEEPKPDLSKQWTVDFNDAKVAIPKLGKTAKSPAEVDKYMNSIESKYGNDASITKELNELRKMADEAKGKIKGRNGKAALVKALKKAIKDNKVSYEQVAGQKNIPLTVNGKNYNLDVGSQLTGAKVGYPLSYGKTPLDTIWFSK